MRLHAATAVLALAAAATAVGPARANPADAYGFGARSSGLAGAVGADVSDFSANYANPAGLARARGLELSVGVLRADPELTLDGRDSRVDAAQGVVAGIVAPGRIAGVPFAFGLAAHVPDQRLSRARTLEESEPRWILYDNRPQFLYLSANLAVAPVRWLAVGGGIGFMAATEGSFHVTGTAVLPDAAGVRSQYDSQLTHEVDAALTVVRYAQAGVLLAPRDDLRFAATFRDEAQVDLRVSADLRGQLDAGLLDVPLAYAVESETVEAFVPRRVGAAASVDATRALRIDLEIDWVQWSHFRSPASRTLTRLDVRAPAGLPLDVPGNTPPTTPEPARFGDRFVPRVGVEYRVSVGGTAIPVRAGYAFERSPVSDQTGRTNFVDTDRHRFALGVGIAHDLVSGLVPASAGCDLFGEYSALPSRLVTKQSPADFVGDYRASGFILVGGIDAWIRFR